jgi:hypothetical protein
MVERDAIMIAGGERDLAREPDQRSLKLTTPAALDGGKSFLVGRWRAAPDCDEHYVFAVALQNRIDRTNRA